MAEKHIVKFHFIAKFFGDGNRFLVRGENAFTSGHVTKFRFDGTVQPMRISAEVLPSMKKLNYTVEISYDLEEGVKTAHCTCPRGNVACHHMAAALYYAHYNVSATDIECQWSAPSKTTPQTEVIKLADVYKPKLSNYTALSRSSTEDEIIQFRAEIGVTNVVGFTWLLRPEASEEARKIIADIEEILQSLEYVQAIDKQKFLLEKCRIDEARIKLVEACTRGQHVNENWHVARKHRLTASRFGMVLSACSRRRFPPSLFKNLAEGYSLDRVAAVQWGKTHEKTALREFEEATNLKVQETGFWLEESGFLGASPDGLVEEDGILEIKCPYKYRDTDSLSEALKDKKYFYWRDENEDINLNSNHNYYHQVQGQMHITGRSICYFVVWTPKCTEIFQIEKDPGWSENINILKEFYLDQYISFISQ